MHELLTNSEMRRADALAVASGIPSLTLMENAGRAVADVVISAFGVEREVTICAGPGNNGGDGFVAARVLSERGCRVRLTLLGAREGLSGDAAEMAERYRGAVIPWAGEGFDRQGVLVDAIFGSGLARPVEGKAAALIGAINQSGAPVVAVDLPSGINGDTGSVLGEAVRAEWTTTFFRKKPAHLLLPGRFHCGRVVLAQIGIPASVLDDIRPLLSANDPAAWARGFPVPEPSGHKYSRGHTVVLSGDLPNTGAAR
ncbi:MAG: NAD(P)H-hydrate epimerase, partial [Pseudorhodoplanes sp.]